MSAKTMDETARLSVTTKAALRRVPPAAPRVKLFSAIGRRPALERGVLWTLAVAITMAIWELAARVIVKNDLFLPPFSKVVVAAWDLFVVQHSIYGDMWVSAQEAGIGYLLSLTAVPLGLIIGASRRATIMVEPINSAMYALPHISLVPLAVVWFGLGQSSKVFIVFLTAFFLILINTIAGVSTVDRELRDVAIAFHVSRFRTFTTVILPGTVPFIFAGLQLGIGRALIGVVGAELFASNKGLGYLLGQYGNQFQTADLFVAIATFAVAGAALSAVVGIIGRRFDNWRTD
jgi:NitT/TauT family transport system permease protein